MCSKMAGLERRHALSITRSLQRHTGEGLVTASTKNESSERVINISPECIARLKLEMTHQKAECLANGIKFVPSKRNILCWGDGRPVDPDYITNKFDDLTKTIEKKLIAAREKDPEIPEYNLDIRFHDLRHCHATTLLEAGINVKAVSERLGHSTTRTTLDIYTHVTKSMQKEIADRIDSLFISKNNPLAK